MRGGLQTTNGELEFSVIKNVFAIVIFGMTTSLSAELVFFSSFQIEIQDTWEHSFENAPGDDSRSVISLRHPDGVGSLKISSYDAPDVVSEDRLRNLTNVDSSTLLTWQNWGDYSGYQYDYFEGGSFYRQWWLVSERTILYIVYQCDPESRDIETEEIDMIVRSITAGNA